MNRLVFLFWSFFLVACTADIPVATEKTDRFPEIFPDYVSVTVPEQIAPLNFEVTTHQQACVVFAVDGYQFVVHTGNGDIHIPSAKWKKLLAEAKGKSFQVSVIVHESGTWKSFKSFPVYVSADSIDPYIAYRLIAPGYQLWNEMGIYQRRLASYKETPLLENRLTDNNCMNCHSFCNQDPDKMLFHIRAAHGCTVFIDGGEISTFDTKTDYTIANLVYPYWHPSGNYIAFSVNNTTQDVDPVHRTEVYDKASDVVVYDVGKQEIVTTHSLFSSLNFETFPAFSPDGRSLYFCTAKAVSVPDEIEALRYSICRISFDEHNRTFGTSVDTIFNAELEGKSALFPRISPDGNYLLFTVTAYGTFPIWHEDADLMMIRLADGKHIPVDDVNSLHTDSYHSWSSNSRWVVFSSRRIDGLHTRLFISHVDDEGRLSKPFLLPQRSKAHDAMLMKSYNIPEFVKGKVNVNSYDLSSAIKKGKNKPVRFVN